MLCSYRGASSCATRQFSDRLSPETSSFLRSTSSGGGGARALIGATKCVTIEPNDRLLAGRRVSSPPIYTRIYRTYIL